jgi:ubiquitin-protein ligase
MLVSQDCEVAMLSLERQERIRSELAALEAIRTHSSIFSFQVLGTPVERLSLSFHGAGLARPANASLTPQIVREHQLELRLPTAYPLSPPDIRWLTPILHPNISFSGFVNLADVGLIWEPNMGLDLVCERLWDMARLAEFNLDKAVSYSAKKWLVEQREYGLPVDLRPLRDRAAGSNRNVVKYRRKGQPAPLESDVEVLYIDDETPAPPLPPASSKHVEKSIKHIGLPRGSSDLFYID